MSQRAFLREVHAEIAADFVDAGLADRGTYTPKGGAPIACTVIVRNDLGTIGEVAQVNARFAVLTLFKSEVGEPAEKGRVDVTDGDSFELVDRKLDDGSRSAWGAKRV